MSVYTTVTPEQLGVWLTQHNVGTLVDLRGISAGIENTNYFVITERGRFVLTVQLTLNPSVAFCIATCGSRRQYDCSCDLQPASARLSAVAFVSPSRGPRFCSANNSNMIAVVARVFRPASRLPVVSGTLRPVCRTKVVRYFRVGAVGG